jgi:hypothetical protein
MLTLNHALRQSASVLAVLAIVFVAGCAGTPRTPVDSLKEVGNNQVILVGRVTVVPPVHASEQSFSVFNQAWANRMVLLTSDEKRPLTAEPVLADYDGRIDADLGKTFFVAVDPKPIYVRAGVLLLNDHQGERLYFPAGFQLSVRPGDKAVYIGTIEYQRDDFMNIKRVRIGDDFDKASKEFKEKFGGKVALRKALVTPQQPRNAQE